VVSGLSMDQLEEMVSEVGLADLPRVAAKLLKGLVKGRLVVKLGPQDG
jgi:NADPH-dependent curcumin reductase CurA